MPISVSDPYTGGTGSNVPPVLTTGGVPAPLAISELYIDPETGDIPSQPYIISGGPAVAQKVRSRFRFFLGEWFLDTRLGVPYLQRILIKGARVVVINAIFRQVLKKTPGVASITSFSANWNTVTRTLTFNFQATLIDGTVMTATDEPFIVT